jgi:hypothetical protein
MQCRVNDENEREGACDSSRGSHVTSKCQQLRMHGSMHDHYLACAEAPSTMRTTTLLSARHMHALMAVTFACSAPFPACLPANQLCASREVLPMVRTRLRVHSSGPTRWNTLEPGGHMPSAAAAGHAACAGCERPQRRGGCGGASRPLRCCRAARSSCRWGQPVGRRAGSNACNPSPGQLSRCEGTC